MKFDDPANIPAETRLGVAFGDSTMLRTGVGLSEWGRATEDLWLAGRIGDMLGCGIGRGGERRTRGRVAVAPSGCDDWPEIIASEIPRLREKYGRIEFAIVQTGPWDVADRRLDGDDTWTASTRSSSGWWASARGSRSSTWPATWRACPGARWTSSSSRRGAPHP